MASENEFLLHAFLLGVLVTLLYDLLRIFRRIVPHNLFFVSVEDLGFWVYCGAEVFLLMYRESNGTLRWFAVFGALLGMALYRKLCSPFLVKYISLILGKVLGWLSWPLRKLLRLAGKGAAKTGSCIAKVVHRIGRQIKNKLTYFLKMLKIGLKK